MEEGANGQIAGNRRHHVDHEKSINDEDTPLVGRDYDTVSDVMELHTWRRYLVGPILCLYMIAYMSSYYVIIEFTNGFWLDKKFNEANLTRNSDTSSSRCNVNTSSPEYKTESIATSISSRYLMYFSLAQGVPAIVSTLMLGSYTDFIGRKFLFIVGISGTAIRLSFCFCVVYFKLDLLWVVVASLIEGCTGQYCTTMQVCFAYVSDITSGKQRTYGIAILMSVLGLSLTVSSLSVGYLISAYGYYIPFAIYAVLLIACLLVVILFLPESLPSSRRKKQRKTVCNILYNTFSFLLRNDLGNNRWKFILLFLSHAFAEFSFLGRVGVETIYQMSAPFCWSADKVGVYAAIRTAAQVTIGIGSIKIFQLCLSDVAIAMLGCLSYAASFFITAIATNDTMLYIVVGVNFLGAMEGTMSRSVCSSLADPTQQGAIFSALASVEIVVNLLSNVGDTGIYSLTTGFMRGFVFLVLSACATIGAILLLILIIGWKIENRNTSKRLP